MGINRDIVDINQFSPTQERKLYWLMQFLGWFSLLFIEVFNLTFFILGEFNWQYVFSLSTFSGIGLMTTHFYKSFFIPPSTFSKNFRRLWGKALLDISLISGSIVFLIRLRTIAGPNSMLAMTAGELLVSLGPQLINTARYVMIWIIIYYLYHILKRNNAILKEKLEAEVSAKTTELELLRTQLNPAFLFQSLESTKLLVSKDKEKARNSILNLSELLRYTLNYEKTTLVPVRSELAELNKYIDLEKIHWGDQLEVILEIDQYILDEKIPTASLINLLEFAIRSEQESPHDQMKVRLLGKSMEDSVLLQVEFQNQIPESEAIKNLRLRIQKIYGIKGQLTFFSKNPQQIGYQLILPKNQ